MKKVASLAFVISLVAVFGCAIFSGNAQAQEKKIAAKLSISNRTVEHHRANIMKKIGVKNVASLIKYALKAGLVDLV